MFFKHEFKKIVFIFLHFSDQTYNPNCCTEVKPWHKILTPPQLDGAGSHYVARDVKFPMQPERGGEELAGAVNMGSEKQRVPLSKVSKFMDRAWRHAPPLLCFLLVFPDVFGETPPVSLLLSLCQSLPFCIFKYRCEYHCGAEIPS